MYLGGGGNFTQYLTDLCFCIFGHVADLILLHLAKTK